MFIEHSIGFMSLELMTTTTKSTQELNSLSYPQQSELTNRPRKHFSNRNNRKYTDKRSNGATTGQKS